MTPDAQIRAFGRYQLHRQLGQGGMGTVYLAHDTALNRWVALKIPEFGSRQRTQVIERFRREAQVAASIEHPNVCSILDIGEVNGVHYLTMPYIQGPSLAQQLDPDHPWPSRDAAVLITKLAGALGALHGKGLIHRDLKPGNVLLRASEGSEPSAVAGEPILVDFGLARSFTDPGHKMTRTGQLLGTPSYMSPEQVTGAADQGPATDIYALGVIFYELLTGQVPFGGGSVEMVCARILHAQPTRPSEVHPALGPSEDALVLKALAKDPTQRYASMAEFAEAVQGYLQRGWSLPLDSLPPAEEQPNAVPQFAGRQVDTPTRAPGPETTPSPADHRQPWRIWLAVGLANVLLVGLAVAVLGWWLRSGTSEPGPTTQGKLTLQVVPETAVSIGGTRTVEVLIVRDQCPGTVELHLRDLPPGVTASPAFIARGATLTRVTLTAHSDARVGRFPAHLRAVAGSIATEVPLLVEVLPRGSLPQTITNSIGMKLVLIPAGKFLMGSPKDEKDRREDEGPQHEVEISRPFYLGVYEVTQEQYEKVMGYNPSYFSRDGKGAADGKYSDFSKPAGGAEKVTGLSTENFPVENVSWEEAVEFCKKLSNLENEKISGRVYRLPSEAQWEYSCRGGADSTTPFHFGRALTSHQANFNGKSPYGTDTMGPHLGRTTQVGSHKPNAFGLYNMHGNVCEWCHDWYGEDYYTKSQRRDPQGPDKGSIRVIRGGGWGYDGRYCRSALRSWSMPAFRGSFLGFRVALVPSGK